MFPVQDLVVTIQLNNILDRELRAVSEATFLAERRAADRCIAAKHRIY